MVHTMILPRTCSPAPRGKWHRVGGAASAPSGKVTMSGFILLAFLAVLVAYFWNRFRRRAGLTVSGRTWAGVIVVFVLLVLMLWAAGNGR